TGRVTYDSATPSAIHTRSTGPSLVGNNKPDAALVAAIAQQIRAAPLCPRQASSAPTTAKPAASVRPNFRPAARVSRRSPGSRPGLPGVSRESVAYLRGEVPEGISPGLSARAIRLLLARAALPSASQMAG